jgi:hypothetical protein
LKLLAENFVLSTDMKKGGVGLDSSVTDDTVKQLSEIGMLKIMSASKIILTQEAFAAIHRSETSG